MHNQEQLPQRVYYVESSADSSVLIGMNVQLRGPWITWHDTVKQRRMQIASVERHDAENFTFIRAGAGGAMYSFQPLTLEIYAQKVKPQLPAAKDYSDLEALLRDFEAAAQNNG